jgi:catechol 2,3-dioxygenase
MDRPYGLAPPGFRLPDATRIGAVHLQVADLGRSIDYYQGVLGMRVLERAADRAALGPHGADRTLVRLSERSDARPARGEFGLYHFAILLPDRAALGRFVAHLLRLGVRPGMADHLVSEALYLTDPDGLGIEVYADRPRASWKRNGRELAMATDPLDVRGLIAAGGDSEWIGMPDGTTMGHLHLHVGDLTQAEAYYHAALGFDKMVWSYPGALFLAAGGYHHHLGANTWSRGPAAAADQARLLDWELVVPDAAHATAAARSLQAAGFGAEQISAAWLSADPWGTALRIIAAI